MTTIKIKRADIQAYIDRENSFIAMPPVAISAENFDEMLGCLPPNHFTGDSFTNSEMSIGNITTMYARKTVGDRTHHICKNVRISGNEISDCTRIKDEDFEAVEADCEEIAEIEANIYGEENSRTYEACKYLLGYVSGDQHNLIGAYKLMEETNCVHFGSASDVAYDYLENCYYGSFKDIEPFFGYMDAERLLSDHEFREAGYHVWINTIRAGSR